MPTDNSAPAAVRVAVLVHHPAQHFAEGYRLLAGQPGLEALVYFWDAALDGRLEPDFGCHVRWRADLHSGYDWWSPPSAGSPSRRAWAMVSRLRRQRPDVVLAFGWASPAARAGVLYATLTHTPLLFYGDTNGFAAPTGRRVRLRHLVHRALLTLATGAVATGGANRQFYLSHGMAPEQLHPGVCPADVAAFATAGAAGQTGTAGAAGQTGTAGAAGQTGTAGKAGRSGDPLIIGFAGKFIAAKGIPDLLNAAAGLDPDPPWELVLVGDGPLRSGIELLVARLGLRGRVHFLGFRNTDEMPALLAGMDIVVVPSQVEARGLVAVEAMAAGAAVVVSSATGVWGPGDVLRDGENGFVYPVGDVTALTARLRVLISDPLLRRRVARSGRASAAACGPGDFAATTAAAIIATAAARPRAPASPGPGRPS